MKRLFVVVLAMVAVVSLTAGVVLAAKPGSTDGTYNGNGAPSGAHFNLNLIGMDQEKSVDTSEGGNRIFVRLWGTTKILLSEAPEGMSFLVIDPNGTDGAASFQLPNPDPDGDGVTVYSVYARYLGKPGYGGNITTMAIDPGLDGILGTADDVEITSVMSLVFNNSDRPGKFENVSKELLYIYADINADGNLERVSLFDDALQGYFWNYDNQGCKLVQLRFYYDLPTTVPDPSEA